MASTSTLTQANGHSSTGPSLRLLAEAVVALQHTLGCGDEDDNRALDQLERSVWLELRRVCTDRQEREHHIAVARGLVASPGAPSCHHAARLMSLTAQALANAIAGADADERRRIESLASRCAEAAGRLQRIATEAARPEMGMIERAPSVSEACFGIVAEHAAQTSAAIRQERSARLVTELESYGKALSDLADELAHDRISDSEEATSE